jgi:hypothetical protein
MNMKNISMFLLPILLICFINIDAGEKGGMERIKNESEQVYHQLCKIKTKHKSALSQLMATEQGQLYKQAGRDCYRKGNCYNCPDFEEAIKQLKQTDEYRDGLLPIKKQLAYLKYKDFGLRQMVYHVDAGTLSFSDIETALFKHGYHIGAIDKTDWRAGLHCYDAIGEEVHNELRAFIRTEKRILKLQEAEASMPTYQ